MFDLGQNLGRQSRSVWRSIALWMGLIVGFTQTAALAQITPDNALGAEQSRLLPNNTINGGAQRGANLFHSFLNFNVGNGQQVFFVNPAGVERIFSRVTGNSRSNILGTLGVQGTADLLLINPNGIFFGPNARLNVRGSFLATTASAVQFGDQGVFSADRPDTPALLIINPSALWFNRLQTAPIVNQSVAFAGASPGGFGVFGLRVPNGRNLLLVGGAVQLDQGGVAALGGRVELGGLAAPGSVALTPDYQLSFPAGVERADVSLTNGAIVDVAAGGKGDVVVTARNIDIGQQSAIYAGLVAPGGTATRQAGTIALDATGAMTLDGEGSTLENSASANVLGKGGDIQIRARSVAVTNGANVLTLNGRQGNAGNINIATTDTIAVDGFGNQLSSAIASQVSRGVGNGGTVTLTTRQLSLTNSGNVGTTTFARGNAGDVRIVADTITVDGVGSTRSSNITSSVAPRAVGNGGVIDIQTGLLSITNGGRLFASTFGQGNGGEIRVNARDRVALDGSGSNQFSSAIVSQVATPGIGNGGTLQINAPTVTLTNGAQLATSTFGRGRAGDITIQARDAVVFDGVGNNDDPSGALSSVEARAIGNGGNISINSEAFRLTNDAGLFASTSGRGDAGKIHVQSGTVALATGGRILSTVEPTGMGNGQEIAIETRSLSLTSNAQINASTAGDGKAGQIQVVADSLEANTGGRLLTSTASRRDAGDIQLQVRDRINLTGADSGLFANTAVGSSGNGGTIFVQSKALALQDAARISVDSQGTGVGGNIGIQSDSLRLSDRATISAETQSNTGGNLTLNVPELLLLRRGSTISTTAGKAQGTGDGGNITIAAGFVVGVSSENSDITANAFRGNGGNINITTQGIFGLSFRDRLTPLSDITASSQFGLNGIVTINTLAIDPIQGTVQLPTAFSTPPIAQGCQASSRTSRFVNQGRGGVPSSPVEPLTSDTIWQDWEAIDTVRAPERATPTEPNYQKQAQAASEIPAIVEAQGWLMAPNGEVRLVTQAKIVTPYGIAGSDRSLCQ